MSFITSSQYEATSSGLELRSRWSSDCHRRHRRLPKFSIGVLTRFAFGTVTTVSAAVRIRVVRKLISMTSPSTESTMTQSPTLNGRSSSTVVAPNRFEIVSFAARASANPEMPSPAISDVRLNPSASAMNTAPSATIRNRKRLSTAEMSVFSEPSSSPSLSNNSTTSLTMETSRNAQATSEAAKMTCSRFGRKSAITLGKMKLLSSSACSLIKALKM